MIVYYLFYYGYFLGSLPGQQQEINERIIDELHLWAKILDGENTKKKKEQTMAMLCYSLQCTQALNMCDRFVLFFFVSLLFVTRLFIIRSSGSSKRCRRSKCDNNICSLSLLPGVSSVQQPICMESDHPHIHGRTSPLDTGTAILAIYQRRLGHISARSPVTTVLGVCM